MKKAVGPFVVGFYRIFHPFGLSGYMVFLVPIHPPVHDLWIIHHIVGLAVQHPLPFLRLHELVHVKPAQLCVAHPVDVRIKQYIHRPPHFKIRIPGLILMIVMQK